MKSDMTLPHIKADFIVTDYLSFNHLPSNTGMFTAKIVDRNNIQLLKIQYLNMNSLDEKQYESGKLLIDKSLKKYKYVEKYHDDNTYEYVVNQLFLPVNVEKLDEIDE
jgi:hypothetical protein